MNINNHSIIHNIICICTYIFQHLPGTLRVARIMRLRRAHLRAHNGSHTSLGLLAIYLVIFPLCWDVLTAFQLCRRAHASLTHVIAPFLLIHYYYLHLQTICLNPTRFAILHNTTLTICSLYLGDHVSNRNQCIGFPKQLSQRHAALKHRISHLAIRFYFYIVAVIRHA